MKITILDRYDLILEHPDGRKCQRWGISAGKLHGDLTNDTANVTYMRDFPVDSTFAVMIDRLMDAGWKVTTATENIRTQYQLWTAGRELRCAGEEAELNRVELDIQDDFDNRLGELINLSKALINNYRPIGLVVRDYVFDISDHSRLTAEEAGLLQDTDQRHAELVADVTAKLTKLISEAAFTPDDVPLDLIGEVREIVLPMFAKIGIATPELYPYIQN